MKSLLTQDYRVFPAVVNHYFGSECSPGKMLVHKSPGTVGFFRIIMGNHPLVSDKRHLLSLLLHYDTMQLSRQIGIKNPCGGNLE